MSTTSLSRRQSDTTEHPASGIVRSRSGIGTLSRLLSSLVALINQSDRKLTDSGVINPIVERVSVVATQRR
ncbi:hypothetical protein [Rhodopirellula islandica]|uniref:hypothetical protein n=1 Tax=Rhodopirellula islandica TaxID=595434 RepID=UPI0009FAF501|nr:hypothetical protein [Rhodopirellula islandica]